MTRQPELVNIEQLSEGWINKYVLTYRRPDGRMHTYECASRKKLEAFRSGLERRGAESLRFTQGLPSETRGESTPDAVCIVARTSRNTLVMIREFRYPLNSWCIAFPAGLVDQDEDIVECARRELAEETGFEVLEGADVRVLPQAGFSSTGMTDETVQVVFVEAEKAGDAHTEPNELIEVFELPICDVADFLATNTLPIGTRAQLILERYAAASR